MHTSVVSFCVILYMYYLGHLLAEQNNEGIYLYQFRMCENEISVILLTQMDTMVPLHSFIMLSPFFCRSSTQFY